MDYPCGKFGDCSLSRFGSIMQTNRQTDTQSDADDHYTHATPGQTDECWAYRRLMWDM